MVLTAHFCCHSYLLECEMHENPSLSLPATPSRNNSDVQLDFAVEFLSQLSPMATTDSKQAHAQSARSRRATQSPQGEMSPRMVLHFGFGLRVHSETCRKVTVSSPPKQPG
jgi:hypothetical protein